MTDENSPPPSNQPLSNTPDPRTSAFGNILLLCLLTWLPISVTDSGAINPSSGITGMEFKVFYPAAARLNQGRPLYQPNLDISLQRALYCYTPLPAKHLRPLRQAEAAKSISTLVLRTQAE